MTGERDLETGDAVTVYIAFDNRPYSTDVSVVELAGTIGKYRAILEREGLIAGKLGNGIDQT